MDLSEVERERQESWALLSQIALRRGAGSGVTGVPNSALPGGFPREVELEYQRLRAAFAALREAGSLDRAAHERFRADARALLERVTRG